MEIANVFTDEWDEEQEHEGFRIREAQIGPRLGLSGKLDTVSAKSERILLTRHAEPAKYWDGES